MGIEKFKVKSCLSKKKYKNINEAMNIGKFSVSINKVDLYTYLCKFCNSWHLTRSITKYKII